MLPTPSLSTARNDVHLNISSVPLPVLTCGSLVAFLGLLKAHASVLLMPLQQRTSMAAINTHHVALLLSACSTFDEHLCLLICLLPIATYTEVGGHGRFLSPFPSSEQREQALEEATDVFRTSLVACVKDVLLHETTVGRVHLPAMFCLPEQWVWQTQATLEGSGIQLCQQTGQWFL